MPAIFDAQIQSPALLRTGDSGAAIKQLGNLVQAVAQKKEEENFAIDLSNFQMKQIAEMEKIQNGGEYVAHEKKDRIGGQEIEGGIPQYYMKQFNDSAYEIESRYGQRGKDAVANYRVNQFAKITNLYSNIRSTGEINNFENHVKATSQAVRSGSAEPGEAYGTSLLIAESLSLNPQQRDYVKQLAANEISYAEFQKDLAGAPLNAIDKLESGLYNQADFSFIDKMNGDVDRYVSDRGRKEIQAAQDSFSAGFKHNADPLAYQLAKKRGNNDLAKAIALSNAAAAQRDALVSYDLPENRARINAAITAARAQNDPAAFALAQANAQFMQKRMESVSQDPYGALMEENVDVSQQDLSSPEALVATSQDIKTMAEERFGIPVSFLGPAAGAIVGGINQMQVNKRAEELFRWMSPMNADQKRQSSAELSGLSPSVGVAASLIPTNSKIIPSMQTLDLATAILSGGVKEFTPSQDKWNNSVNSYFAGVDVGDKNVMTAVSEAAKNAYSYYAQKQGVPITEINSDIFDDVMNRVSGKPVSLLSGKTLNFMLDDGTYADEDKSSNAIEEYVKSGALDHVVDDDGHIIDRDMILDSGRLIPTSTNGVYYLSTDDNRYFKDAQNNYIKINMVDVYGKYGDSSSFGFW